MYYRSLAANRPITGNMGGKVLLFTRPYVPLWAGASTESSEQHVFRLSRTLHGNFPIGGAGRGLGSWRRRRYRIAVFILRIVIGLERFPDAWWFEDATHKPESSIPTFTHGEAGCVKYMHRRADWRPT